MRYWVYISDKVEGPFEEEKLVTLQGFTPDTLICAEDAANSGNQEWAKASSVFEFDQVPAAAPAAEPQSAPQPAAAQTADSGVTALLLGKLEELTAQISGMQAKIEGMQTKLDEAVTAAQQASANTRPEDSYVPPQDDALNTITLTRHEFLTEENTAEAAAAATESVAAAKTEDIAPAAAIPQEQPVDMLGPVDLGDSAESTGGEDMILSSAMDSLYNAQLIEQTQKEKESTFQDLLTPAQAEALAAQADALKKETAKLDNALAAAEKAAPAEEAKPAETPAQVPAEAETPAAAETAQAEAPAADEAAKEAVLAEFTAAAEEPKENVLDQVIKEKQEEQQAVELNLPQETEPAVAEIETVEVKTEEKQEEPAAVEPLDFSDNNAPALAIAPDAKQPEVTEEVLPASQMPADQPAQPTEEAKPAEAAKPASAIPSIDDISVKEVTVEDKKEETLQELVPGAKMEKPDNGLITEEDLKDAFTERAAQSDQSVEQLFGIDATQQQPVHPEPAPEDQEIPSLDAIGQQTADQPLPVANPNDLTEIELKEGSTYLISDFVPPAKANDSIPQELADLQASTKAGASAEKPAAETEAEKTAAFTEIVTSTQQMPEPTAEEQAVSDVTVSQVILENTIKSKRGASLDIKTVPMVQEPAQSDRLQIDGLDDDINAQHDLKAADSKGKTKMIIGAAIAVILAVLIYVMLAFMNLIPAQLNFLSSNKAQAAQTAARQDQMNEMYNAPQPVQNFQQPQAAAASPMDGVLAEVKNYPLANGFTLKEFIEAKHPAAQSLITWDISTAVDPDNYSVLVKVPPENPQSFKISYRFNYNTVTKALDPTISDAKNLLDSATM